MNELVGGTLSIMDTSNSSPTFKGDLKVGNRSYYNIQSLQMNFILKYESYPNCRHFNRLMQYVCTVCAFRSPYFVRDIANEDLRIFVTASIRSTRPGTTIETGEI